MKTLKKLGIALLFMSLLTACGMEDEDEYDEENTVESSQPGDYGYCSDFNGKTVVLSVFVDDPSHEWSSNEGDKAEILNKLGIATDWLAQQSEEYGGNGNYIYDFEENEDLYYEMTANVECEDADNMANEIDAYIEENLDLDAIKAEYDADNVLCTFYANSDNSNEMTDWTIKWEADSENDYEYCFFYNEVSDGKLTPATISHEFMHAFGAPDLYAADTDGYNKGITQEYVDELESENSNDVMFTTFSQDTQEPIYDEVTNEFSELDAYYVGITDSCDLVDEYGFDVSEYQAN